MARHHFHRDRTDGRLDAPAFHRNNTCIADRLLELFGGLNGDILEVGSGTGQHALAFARAMPNMTWWPTDKNAGSLISIEAWRRHSGPPNLRPGALLDITILPWAPEPSTMPLEAAFAGIIAINVVHISPWDTAVSLFKGAGRYLAAGGHVVLYGPFKRDGMHTAQSNAEFDADLRRRDPSWGVRDIAELSTCAKEHGLNFAGARDAPANNMILVFDKPA